MLLRISLTTVTVTALAFSAPAYAKTKTPAPTGERIAVVCEGAFSADATLDDIIAQFGAENVSPSVEVSGAEGMSFAATVVYPDDPERTLTFHWLDPEEHRALYSVDLPPSWETPNGIYVGMPLSDIAARNGQPITLSGFWWDYGGFLFLFEGGNLYDEEGPCTISVRVQPNVEPAGLDVSAVSGDVEIRSDLPILAKLDVRASQVSVNFEQPDFVE